MLWSLQLTKPGTYKRKPDLPEDYVFGRPTKYKKEYPLALIEWMKAGKSFWTFASNVPCTMETLSEWCRVHPEFSEAKRVGRVFEQEWWDNLLRRIAATGEGNITAIVWAQKNKFPKHYRERLAKQQLDVNQKLNQSITGDFKSLVATMTPEQLYQLSLAMENKAKEIEETHETETTK